MACLLSEEEMVEFSKQPTSWKIMLQRLFGNVVISEVDALTHVVLSEAEIHVIYREKLALQNV